MSELLNICRKILRVLEKNEGLEVEVKFRDVTKDEFFLFLDNLKKKYTHSKIYSIDMYSGDRRFTFIDDEYYETSKTELSRDFIKIDDRLLKFTVSKEENELISRDNIRTFDFSRKKDRHRFYAGNFYIDLTQVHIDKESEESYEVEIEVADNSKYNPEEFRDIIIENIKAISLGYEKIFQFCNQSLSDGRIDSSKGIDGRLVSRPRDLLKVDVIEPDSILRNYTVSVKADGIPYFLVFFTMKIFLVSSKEGSKPLLIGENDRKTLDNSMFSGELVDVEYDGFQQVFLVFDTIAVEGKNISSKNYDVRFEYSKRVNDYEIITDGLRKIIIMEKKIFPLGNNSESFYQGFRECYQYKKEIFYQDDGYIFTPIESPYVPEGQKQRRKVKSLSKYQDVCKFKPVEKRSMDFIVYDGKIYYYNPETKSTEVFNKLKYSLDFPEDLNDKIVEFFPVMEDGKVVSLEPRRIRYEKSFPNSKDNIEEIFRSYTENNPITEKTFLGEDTVLMRDYNNVRTKKKLIDSIKGYVIDIGAGRGGDIMKFGINRKIKKVLSVEPNKEFASEFRERLSRSKFSKKFSLLFGVKGEEGDKISRGMNFFPENMQGEELSITFMASLSYFFQDDTNLRKLVKTIEMIREEYKRRGGNKSINLVYFTIDGYKVENFFKKISSNEAKLGIISLKFDGVNTLEVDIPDSKTARNLEEYLVKLKKLFEPFHVSQINEKDSIVPESYLMSSGEREYISLWSDGYAKIPLEKKENEHVLERIPVSSTEGIEKDGLLLAEGEDTVREISNIGENYYRIGTLDFGLSLIHSILKLIDEEYRSSDVFQRMRMAEQLEEYNDLGSASKHFNVSIKSYKGRKLKIIGNFGTYVCLNECKDNSYEPVVFMDSGELKYVFHVFDN